MKNFCSWVMWPLLVSVQLAFGQISNHESKNEIKKDSVGIQWTKNLSWSEILQKAKSDGKYILIDFYATWCLPCKLMDKKVYPDRLVGDIVKDKFIAFKIQCDKTPNDDSQTIARYSDADKLMKEFNINSFPTFLFFSPDGRLVHRVSQGLDVNGFIEMVNSAIDPAKQYFTQLQKYKQNPGDTTDLKQLARSTRDMGDLKLAKRIAEEYLAYVIVENLKDKDLKKFVSEFPESVRSMELARSYINQIRTKDFFIRDNIEFSRQFTKSSKEIGFQFFYNYPEKVNKIMATTALPKGAQVSIAKNDYAQSFVRWIIYSEGFLNPILKPLVQLKKTDTILNWKEIESKISKKYPKAQVTRIIIDAKVAWYGWQQDWSRWSSNLLLQMKLKYEGKDLKVHSISINNDCWSLFERVSDRIVLQQAIAWMEKLFKETKEDRNWATGVDTYANLLYKAGRIKEALYWEEQATKINPLDSDIKAVFEKMKNGKPTWPQ